LSIVLFIGYNFAPLELRCTSISITRNRKQITVRNKRLSIVDRAFYHILKNLSRLFLYLSDN